MMALVGELSAGVAGTLLAFGNAAAADTCNVGAGRRLLVWNTDASSHDVTLATPGNTVFGAAIADVTVTVAAGTIQAIDLIEQYRDLTTNTVALTWSATTGMKRIVLL